MNPIPPPGSSDEDEVLTFFDRIENSLKRLQKYLWHMISGIFVFFIKHLPKQVWNAIKGFLEHLWEYLGRFIRILLRLVLVVVLLAILVAILVGPGVAIYHYAEANPVAMLAWVVLGVFALLFAFQRRIRKMREEWKRRKAAQTGRHHVCGHCSTTHNGPVAPAICSYCKEKWTEAEV